MSYRRVIPRDLFNEANLLKCYGRFWINLESGRYPDARLEFEDEGTDAPFDVHQDEADGSLFILNVVLFVRGVRCKLRRPLNSRESWSLYLITGDDDIAVFNDRGNFSDEMGSYLAGDSPSLD